MPSDPQYLETVRAGSLDGALYLEDDLSGLPALTRGAVLTALSRAFDLAENRRPGHAQRVAHIALSVAQELHLPSRQVEEAFFGGLLHDVGMASTIFTDPDQVSSLRPMSPYGADAERDGNTTHTHIAEAVATHCIAGARTARKLGLSEGVAAAIEQHHDRWSGFHLVQQTGRERGGWVSRIVAASDRLESMIDHDVSPLLVRRRGPELISEMSGIEIDPRIAEAMDRAARQDEFWLGLYDNEMHVQLMMVDSSDALPPGDLIDMLGVVSDVVDDRGNRPRGHGRRVADLSRVIAREHGMSEGRTALVQAAALLQDLGTLGVPVSLMRKPDILTVDEMAAMQMHPTYARDIVSELPGFGAVAWWIGCHHERIDGKGYPGMLEEEEVPVEAQIIGMAEVFIALTSERSYRPAMTAEDAMEVIRGLGSTRFDHRLLPGFEMALASLDLV